MGLKSLVYLIPGRDETLKDDLGGILSRMGFRFQERELTADFLDLWFREQLAPIRMDLEAGFWKREAVLVGKSMGGYLLLHALADMPPFPGKVLLFSPVLGAAMAQTERGLYVVRPPRADRLRQLAGCGKYPAPRYTEIHTGTEDHGCAPSLAEEIAGKLGNNCRLFLVKGAGHNLDLEYMEKAIRCFFDAD